MTTATPSEKCTNCGEVNPLTLRTCGLCGAVLPWVLRHRADEAATQQSKAAQKKAKSSPSSSQGAPSQRLTNQAASLPLWKRLPKYQGAETPMIGMGNIELPLSSLAALIGFLLLALSPFAPIVNAVIINLTLLGVSPLLGWGNLAAAGIAGVALAQQSLRWCYLSFLLGTASVGFIILKMSQFPIEAVNPWRMVQWGIVPLVLGPIACFVAAFFVGVPIEEETEAANPFGHDEGSLFQNRIYLRLKELSQTHVFQQAIREDPQGLKQQLQHLRGLTNWAQVPEATKRLLKNAESELNDGWELSATPDSSLPESDKAPKWVRGLAASVPVALILFFAGSYLLKPKPIEKDLGVLIRQEWQAKFVMEMSVLMTEHLDVVIAENPDAPSYTLNAQIQMEEKKPPMASGTLTYDRKHLSLKVARVDNPEGSRVVDLSDDVEPNDIQFVADALRDRMKADIKTRQLEATQKAAERDLKNSMRDLDSQFNSLQNRFR